MTRPILAAFLLLVPACGGGTAEPAPAELITSKEAGVLLSAWVDADGAAYFAGGTTGGGEALLLRYDEKSGALDRVPVNGAKTFWWITGTGPRQMWLAGEGGEVHRFDGTTVAREDAGVPADATLFGIWGASADDVWTVGGGIAASKPKRIVRRRQAGVWSSVESPPEVSEDAIYFKVWGPSADTVFIVGRPGAVLAWDGTALRKLDAPAVETYFTIHGCAKDRVWAVGGGASGVLISGGTAGFMPVSPGPDAIDLLNGVVCLPGRGTGPDEVYVAGFSAFAAKVEPEGLTRIDMPPSIRSLMIHGLAGSAADSVYAVGGDLAAVGSDPRRGFAVKFPRR